MALERVKKFIGIGVPGGIDDIVVRAVKTGVAVFLASPVAAAITGGDLSVDKAALVAAVAAAASAALNVIILAVVAALAKFSSE